VAPTYASVETARLYHQPSGKSIDVTRVCARRWNKRSTLAKVPIHWKEATTGDWVHEDCLAQYAQLQQSVKGDLLYCTDTHEQFERELYLWVDYTLHTRRFSVFYAYNRQLQFPPTLRRRVASVLDGATSGPAADGYRDTVWETPSWGAAADGNLRIAQAQAGSSVYPRASDMSSDSLTDEGAPLLH
jgi:hypothetical protein